MLELMCSFLKTVLWFSSMKELEKSSQCQLRTPGEGDVIVGQQSSDVGCKLPFPASQKSLGHPSFSVHADLLGGVVWLVHG